MTNPVVLYGTQSNGETLPVQVDAFGRLVAEGLPGPEGPGGPQGPPGPEGPPGSGDYLADTERPVLGAGKFGRDTRQYFTFYGNSEGNWLTSISSFQNRKAQINFGVSVSDGTVLDYSYTLRGNSGEIWHSGNDGVGSGLDADRLKGRDSSNSYIANTVTIRNDDGDLACRHLRSSAGDTSTIQGAIAYRIQSGTGSGSDNYVRYCNDKSNLRAYLEVPKRDGGNASGTWPISISGSAGNASRLDNIDSSQFLRSDASDTYSRGNTLMIEGCLRYQAASAAEAQGKAHLGRRDDQWNCFHSDSYGGHLVGISQDYNKKTAYRISVSTNGGSSVAKTWTFTGNSGTVQHSGSFRLKAYEERIAALERRMSLIDGEPVPVRVEEFEDEYVDGLDASERNS